MSLSKRLYPLLNTGSTKEDFPIVGWDVKNQIKKKFNDIKFSVRAFDYSSKTVISFW